jgi:hypothetical protein
MAELHNAIVVTWPKSRPLSSYLEELAKASRNDEFIHYRVPSLPSIPFGARCYQVHDGAIRGWLTMLGFSDGSGVIDPITGLSWPKGNYIVRLPRWHPVDPIPMQGFRGWRYYDAEV